MQPPPPHFKFDFSLGLRSDYGFVQQEIQICVRPHPGHFFHGEAGRRGVLGQAFRSVPPKVD